MRSRGAGMAFSPNPSHSRLVIPIPIPEIYALWDIFPFPFHSRKLNPIPPVPIPAKSLTNQNISNHTMCVMSFAFTDNKSPEKALLIAARRMEYKYTDISDYSKHNRLRLRLYSQTFSEQRLLAQASNKIRWRLYRRDQRSTTQA